MGFLNKIIKNSKEEKGVGGLQLPWIPLNNIEMLDVIKDKSGSKTQFIFKHSIRCGISKMILKNFESSYAFTETDVDLYYLDLINFRVVSNEIETKFKVIHESPQLLVIKNGEVVAHASHEQINVLNLNLFV